MANPDVKELRVMLPVAVLAVLDMVALSSGQSSLTAYVKRELLKLALEEQRKASLVAKLPPINPHEMDSQWSDAL